MLKISENSLEWALKHIEKHGDTDIFPVPFEYKVIRHCWESNFKQYLLDQDLLKMSIRPHRRLITPKHRYGFRIATQLDPLDCIIFTALIYEIGQDIENYRIDKNMRVSFSSRFLPNDDGDMYDKKYNWNEYQLRSEELIGDIDNNTFGNEYVVIADIADFFPRIYSHPLENALSACTSKNNHVLKIMRMLSGWNYSVSYGIPVGPSASRLLAEIVLDDVDRSLISENIRHCRFVDDYRIFCRTEVEAYTQLAFLANALFENHGLTLQQHKTRILTAEEFKSIYLISEDRKAFNNLSEKFADILGELNIDAYDTFSLEDIPEKDQREIDALNMIDILSEQIEQEEPDLKLVSFILVRMGKLNDASAIELCFDSIDKLYPIFRTVIKYISQLSCLSIAEKSGYGKRLLMMLDTSIIGHLEYHRAWIFDLFANDQAWNSKNEYVKLINSYTDEFSQRKLILTLGKSNYYFWFKSQKRNFDRFTSWEKRALLAAISCLPGDEAEHWSRSISSRLDVLEKGVTEWALKNF